MVKLNDIVLDSTQLPFGLEMPKTDPGGAGRYKRDTLNKICPGAVKPKASHLKGVWRLGNCNIIFHTKKPQPNRKRKMGGRKYGDMMYPNDLTFIWGGDPFEHSRKVYQDILADEPMEMLLMARNTVNDSFTSFGLMERLEHHEGPYEKANDMRPIVKFKLTGAVGKNAPTKYPALFA